MTGQPISIQTLRDAATRTSPPLMLTDQEKLLALVEAVEAAREHHKHTEDFCGDPGRTDVRCRTYGLLGARLARFTDWPDGTTDSG